MKKEDNELPGIAVLADKALKNAVAKVIEDHRRSGLPIVIWRDGKIVHVPPDEIPIRKPGVDN